jgi:hypothetical protein
MQRATLKNLNAILAADSSITPAKRNRILKAARGEPTTPALTLKDNGHPIVNLTLVHITFNSKFLFVSLVYFVVKFLAQ